jgi:predicted small secreted protein
VFDLNWKAFILGLGSGLAGGIAATYLLEKGNDRSISPEKILEGVKTSFKEQGPILGSWIHMETEPYEKNQIEYRVYKGGISKNADNQSKQFEFIADAATGKILSISQI